MCQSSVIRENIYWLEDFVQMNSLNYYRCFEIALSGVLQMLCSVCFKGKLKSNLNKMSKFYFLKIMLQKINTPYQKSLSLDSLVLTYLRKTMHELSKIFVEHVLHVGLIIKSFDPGPNSHVPDTAGSVLTIGLSINRCFHLKKPVWQERN